MNQALILLLITLVQSRSDGVLLANPNSSERVQSSQLEDWEEPPYWADIIKDYDLNSEPYKKRSITSDTFSRRSALDKNFMRFGRGPDNALQKPCEGERPNGVGFFRSARGLKDNFIRFGRARDNFIRFGREGGKDGFMRFGRARPEDFFRAGKSVRENFIRFGKADRNFLRFGRGEADEDAEDYQYFASSEEPFRRLEKSTRAQENFMRFGKSGKNGTNFLRFGKSEFGSEDSDDSNQEPGPKRKKRDLEFPEKTGRKKATRFFEVPPGFPRRISPMLDGSWQNLENTKNFRLTPFFSVFSNLPKTFENYGPGEKRNQGGSNFIRFG